MTDKPDVSGFTRSEKFITESLTTLKGDSESHKRRITHIESAYGNRLDTLEQEIEKLRGKKDHIEQSAAIEKQKGSDQLKIAIVTGVLTAIAALIAALLK